MRVGVLDPPNRSILQRFGHPNAERNLDVVVSHIFHFHPAKLGEVF